MNRIVPIAVPIALSLYLAGSCVVSAQTPPMGFFITSAGTGQGANLGGLAGADKHCQTLAAAAGAGNRTWRAYLSASASGGQPAVNARDRIGTGPWANAKGIVVAQSVADLHSDKANINADTALDEQGRTINPAGAPNRHDILTGSTPDGRATEMTCQNWTSSGAGTAMLGHHDRLARGTPGSPWNSAHASQGCSAENLRATGGAGLLYCFAAD